MEEQSPPQPESETISRLRKLVKKASKLKKTFKRGQSFTVGGQVISVTKGKAHLSFSGPVEWNQKASSK